MIGSRFSLVLLYLFILNAKNSFTFRSFPLNENDTTITTSEPEYISDGYDNTDDVTTPSYNPPLPEPIPEEPEEPDDANFVYTGCGKNSYSLELTDRIRGGEDAKQKDWPWHAQMNTRLIAKSANKSFVIMNREDTCGASLINENWALTAAHCVHRHIPPNNKHMDQEFTISFGDRKSPNGTVVRSSKQIFVHPYYEYEISQARFDIALVLLNESVRFTRKIVPICLPEVDLELSGHTAYLTGRGIKVDKEGVRSRDGTLQQVEMQILLNSQCLEIASEDELCSFCQQVLRTDSMLCAGLPDGSVSATHGDSGGALVIKQYDGTYTQVGIVSTGHPMYKFGIFTSVAKHLWWIRKILQAHSPPEHMDDEGY